MLIQAYTERMVAPDAGVEEIVANNLLRKQKKALKSFQKALFLKKTLNQPTLNLLFLKVPFLKEQYLVMEKSNTFLARVDTRLLHGQVATGWTHSTHPDRIIVVSDTVCHDKLRTNMIKQAAPSGVQVHVIPIKNMVKANNDPRFW